MVILPKRLYITRTFLLTKIELEVRWEFRIMDYAMSVLRSLVQNLLTPNPVPSLSHHAARASAFNR